MAEEGKDKKKEESLKHENLGGGVSWPFLTMTHVFFYPKSAHLVLLKPPPLYMDIHIEGNQTFTKSRGAPSFSERKEVVP